MSNRKACLNVKRLTAFCDKKGTADGKKNLWGIPVISPAELFAGYTDEVIVIGTSNYYQEIRAALIEHGVKEADIVNLGHYVPMADYRQYFEEPFLRFGEKEGVFVDCGAYDLFNSRRLYELCRGACQIVRF